MHVVVTPCRDEVSLVRNLVKTMSEQTVRPDSWIIVLHNYSDSSIRELEEEINTANVEILAESKNWYTYDLPKNLRGEL